jgi:hypothetical protein
MTDAPDHLSLAAEFPAATDEQWRKLVDGVLKGAAFERLQSRSADGLTIEPLYPRARDAAALAGRAPGTRWQVMQRIDHPDPDACNAEVLHELDNGANGLVLIPAGAYGYGLAPAPDAVERALAGVHLDAGIAIALEFSPHAPGVPMALARLVEQQGLSPAAVNIRFGLDPLGAFARHGRSSAPWRERPPRIASVAADLSKRGFKGPFAAADGRVIHDAGGTEAQELAFALAVAVAYLRGFEAGGITLDAARRMIAFRLTADADQFLTIAKFRAMRRLWQRIEESCGFVPVPAFIDGSTAWRTMTRDDAYVNILRATIAVFSAAVGGADAITVLPFTAARGLPAQHPLCPAGGGRRRPCRRSDRWRRLERGFDRQALRCRLDLVPGDRSRGRRHRRPRTRADPDEGGGSARGARARARRQDRSADWRQRISRRRGRASARCAACNAGGIAGRGDMRTARASAACGTVRKIRVIASRALREATMQKHPFAAEPVNAATSHAVHNAGCRCGLSRRRFLSGAAAMGAAALGTGKASAQARPQRIDVHHHMLPPKYVGERLAAGVTEGSASIGQWTPQRSLEQLDRNGIRTAMLSISQPGLKFDDIEGTRSMLRYTNEYGAGLVRDHNGRFGLMATLPLADIDGSLREMEYALDTLKEPTASTSSPAMATATPAIRISIRCSRN